MSARYLAKKQPKDFAFNDENRQWAEGEIKKYPEDRQASAVLALLWRAQKQAEGWLPEPAIRHVADFLAMPHIRVLEIATFYTMFNLQPVGKHLVQICGTTPCWLNGSDNLKDICRRYIGKEQQLSRNNMLSWKEVECLGACVDAPVVQINDDYFENLEPDSFAEILEKLQKDEKISKPKVSS
jgi:NADH-quinone oxidoreductase subunit E